jgi:hypothetical protein
MKITIDTGRKTVVVHGEAAFEEIVNIVKMVCPEEWASYRLTCENVSIADYNEIGIAIQKKAMFDNLQGNIGWDGEKLPKNTVRDLTYSPKLPPVTQPITQNRQ